MLLKRLNLWLARSVRHRLLAMSLLPLLLVLPLLVLALLLWGNLAYDRLLITKVRADLAVAHGYFEQVLADVGAGAWGVAGSHALQRTLQKPDVANTLPALLEEERRRLGLDFLRLIPNGDPKRLAGASAQESGHGAALTNNPSPASTRARLVVWNADQLQAVAPDLLQRARIALVPTENATPTERHSEERALLVLARVPVFNDAGDRIGTLLGGVLLNQNLAFIDHINHIVYPDGSLPFGSQGTATLFLDDVRVTTNVRLFQDRRAIGTRVSRTVHDRVLQSGQTWLDRAFVVNDWYVSGYEPLVDDQGVRVGMLYVGFLETPFRWVRYSMFGIMGLIFGAVMVVAALLSLRWARDIFRPVERMSQTMERVEAGDASARVGPPGSTDELGALSAHLDHLLDVVDDNTQRLREWGQTLDRKVAQRTLELETSNASLQRAQQQLVQSEKMAAIGQLTASVAHEINNPIAVIQGNLDLMRETLGPLGCAPVREELQLLDQQVERMRLIVTQLLQHARPTEFAGYVEPLNPNQVVSDCLVLVAHLLQQSSIRLEQDLSARASVACHRQELQQVLINLLINAVQAMPQGGTLTLSTRDWLDDMGRLQGAVIEIKDRGPGISDEVRSRLFTPFFTTKADGHGLGLWISADLVQRYGGHLEASNRTDGAGAVLSVWLRSEALAPPVADHTPGISPTR